MLRLYRPTYRGSGPGVKPCGRSERVVVRRNLGEGEYETCRVEGLDGPNKEMNFSPRSERRLPQLQLTAAKPPLETVTYASPRSVKVPRLNTVAELIAPETVPTAPPATTILLASAGRGPLLASLFGGGVSVGTPVAMTVAKGSGRWCRIDEGRDSSGPQPAHASRR